MPRSSRSCATGLGGDLGSIALCIGVLTHHLAVHPALQDPVAKALLDKWKIPMPNQGLSEEEIKQYLAYFKWADQNLQPKGSQQPQPATPGTSLPPSQTRSATPMPGPGTGGKP